MNFSTRRHCEDPLHWAFNAKLGVHLPTVPLDCCPRTPTHAGRTNDGEMQRAKLYRNHAIEQK